MTHPETGATALPPQEHNSHFKRNAIVGGIAAGALAVGSVAFAVRNHEDPKPISDRDPARTVQVDEACKQASFGELSNNANDYVDGAFMPKAKKLESKDDVQPYLNTVFNDGPLGSKIDIPSAAAMESAIVVAAHDGVVSQEYNYLQVFADKVSAYKTPDGLGVAKEDCSRAFATLTQTADYNDNWAQKGEQVTEIRAIRNEQYKINGMELKPGATEDTLKGVEFKLRNASKDMDGFTSVLLMADGRMFVKGVTGGSISIGPNGETTTTVTTEVPTAGEQPNDTTNGATGISEGPNPEANPGPLKEAKPGTDNTPNGGPTTPGQPGGPTTTPGNKPPETQPPVTYPPSTKPPVTQPPTTQPPTTQPPTTQPPTTLPPKETPSTLPPPPPGY